MRKRKMMRERETGRGEVREDWVGGVCVCAERRMQKGMGRDGKLREVTLEGILGREA